MFFFPSYPGRPEDILSMFFFQAYHDTQAKFKALSYQVVEVENNTKTMELVLNLFYNDDESNIDPDYFCFGHLD